MGDPPLWALTSPGHPRAMVLNGGWRCRLAEGYPVIWWETVPEPGGFTPRPNAAMRLRLDELKARLADPAARVVGNPFKPAARAPLPTIVHEEHR